MTTEARNPSTLGIDRLDTLEMVSRINQEDLGLAGAVTAALPRIASAVDEIFSRLSSGGRLFYVGAGTSGRLGVLDAVECPPTFGVEPELVQAVLAGGYEACYQSIEGAEDDVEGSWPELKNRRLNSKDALVGIAASGRTPFTVGALQYGRSVFALTVAVTCNSKTPLAEAADIAIEVETGPEVVTGSTRLKAGTAQKMVLNMISTAVMIRLGHVYDNLMVNVHLKNEKLRRRGARIVAALTGVDEEKARAVLEKAESVRTALVMIRHDCDRKEAEDILGKEPDLRTALGKPTEKR